MDHHQIQDYLLDSCPQAYQYFIRNDFSDSANDIEQSTELDDDTKWRILDSLAGLLFYQEEFEGAFEFYSRFIPQLLDNGSDHLSLDQEEDVIFSALNYMFCLQNIDLVLVFAEAQSKLDSFLRHDFPKDRLESTFRPRGFEKLDLDTRFSSMVSQFQDDREDESGDSPIKLVRDEVMAPIHSMKSQFSIQQHAQVATSIQKSEPAASTKTKRSPPESSSATKTIRQPKKKHMHRADSPSSHSIPASLDSMPKTDTSAPNSPSSPPLILNAPTNDGTLSNLSNEQYSASDGYLKDIERYTLPIIRDKLYNDDVDSYEKIRIAILDTGIAMSSSTRPKLVKNYAAKLQDDNIVSFGGNGSAVEDQDGHGTHVAMLVARVCPNAEIYIAKVVAKDILPSTSETSYMKGEGGIKYATVSEAVKWAISKKVNIINMSFGWRKDDTTLSNLLYDAERAGILIFAATSNYGLKAEIAFPARHDSVIGVDSADGFGKPSKFNPGSTPGNNANLRFTAPGEDVISAYPTDKGDQSGKIRMSGTSFACPIAAGIAGLILEFARQKPLSLEPGIAQLLTQRAPMIRVFHNILSTKEEDKPFRFLQPYKLFEAKEVLVGNHRDWNGGEAYTQGSPRMDAADAIVKCLSGRYNVGEIFYDKLKQMR